MKQVSRIGAHLFLFGAALIYGANYNIAKIAMPEFIAPRAFILMRVVGGALMFGILHRLMINEKITDKGDFKKLFIASIFGAFFNQIIFFEGLSRTSPVNAAVIMVSAPIIVLILSAIFLKEKLTIKKIFGITLGVIGALMMIGLHGLEVGAGSIIGDIFIILNATSYSIYLIIIKPLVAKYHPFTIMKWVFLFAIPMVLPFSFYQIQEVQWTILPGNVIFSMVYVVIGTTFLAYLFNALALQKVNASTTSFYIYFQPLIAGFISVFFFQKPSNGHR